MPQSQQSEVGTNIIVNKIISNPSSFVIDFGAGEGKWGKLLKTHIAHVSGVEVWPDYIFRYNLRTYYDALYSVDLRNIDFSNEQGLILDYKYNIAILGDVLEHVSREEAVKFLAELKTKVDIIYLTIPITICIQDGNAIGNPFETHHYQWSDKEVRYELGFNLLNVSVNDNGLVAIGCYEWVK
jgi:hypothetical protein